MVKRFSILIATILCMVGCNSQSETLVGDSGLYLNLETDNSFNYIEAEYKDGRANYDLSQIVALPVVSDFKLSLYSVETGIESLISSWESVADFTNGAQFAPGDYKVIAEYGVFSEEGENKPYFYGEKSFEVEADKSSSVTITAEMQNSFVMATATQEFKDFFTSGKLLVKVEGRNSIELSPLQNSVPVFMRPGTASLEWEGVRQGGNVKVGIKSDIVIEPKTGYTLNLDVDASKNQIVVKYNNSVDYVPVEVVASDKPVVDMPFIQSSDFESGVQLTFSKSAPLESVKAIVVADGGIKDCTLTLNAATATELGCDTQMSLVSSTVQSFLSLKGLEMKGLDARRDKMAYIDFVGMLQSMSVGSYNFSIVVTDEYSRTSSAMVLKVSVTE